MGSEAIKAAYADKSTFYASGMKALLAGRAGCCPA